MYTLHALIFLCPSSPRTFYILNISGDMFPTWSLHMRMHFIITLGASLVTQMVKNLPAMQKTWVWSLNWEDPLEKDAKDLGLIPGLGRSPGEGNDNPLQYSCLENPMDRGSWWAVVCGVANSQTRLSTNTFTFSLLIIRSIMIDMYLLSDWPVCKQSQNRE